LITTRLLESEVTVTAKRDEDSTLANPASAEKSNDEVHWIRDGLLKAAFSSDIPHDEDKEKDGDVGVVAKGAAVVGPTTVLIYDTTLRGTLC
jgi:hypothetical protein